MICVLMTGCATSPIVASDPVCEYIYASKDDTTETLRQIRNHNKLLKAVK